MRIFGFLSGLSFLVAYIFLVFAVKVAVAISPPALLLAGLLFLVLHITGVDTGLRTRYSNRTTTRA
jgi:hypothetical protein